MYLCVAAFVSESETQDCAAHFYINQLLYLFSCIIKGNVLYLDLPDVPGLVTFHLAMLKYEKWEGIKSLQR